jgi:hypothetical protein
LGAYGAVGAGTEADNWLLRENGGSI